MGLNCFQALISQVLLKVVYITAMIIHQTVGISLHVKSLQLFQRPIIQPTSVSQGLSGPSTATKASDYVMFFQKKSNTSNRTMEISELESISSENGIKTANFFQGSKLSWT